VRAALSAAGLLVGLLAGPAAADGKHVLDEPYRWASGSAQLVSPVYRDGSNPPLNVATAELGPQASVAVPQGALDVPTGATRIGVSLAAVQAPGLRSGRALSNAYALELRDDRGRSLSAKPEKRAVVVLLRTASAPTAEIVAELRTAGGARQLPARQVHEGLYAVDVREPGVLLLVNRTSRLNASAALPVGPAGTVSAAALVLVGSAAAVRRRNGGRTGTAQTRSPEQPAPAD
jgi:hypothetical protein